MRRARMKEYLKTLEPGKIFLTEKGWWVVIRKIADGIATGFLGNDPTSLEVHGYPAKWDLEDDGKEITNPQNPSTGLGLGIPIACPLYI